MKKWAPLVLFFVVRALSEHVIPPEKYGPPYFYPANPEDRLYKLPLAAGESTTISDGYLTDPSGSTDTDHSDFCIDFDMPWGQMVYAARAGKVMYIDEAPGGLATYYTIRVGRVDSIPDSTSTRGNGWRLGMTLDMYRHLNGLTRLVNLGDLVAQGAPIARVNEIRHVHFQVDFNNGITIRNVPTPFVEVTGPGHSEGFVEIYDTYVSQNAPIRIESPRFSLPGRPDAMSLSFFPNPFAAATSVCFSLEGPRARADLEIYDASGRFVEKLWAGLLSCPGDYSMTWSPGRLSRGVYICRLKADGKAVSRRVYRD